MSGTPRSWLITDCRVTGHGDSEARGEAKEPGVSIPPRAYLSSGSISPVAWRISSLGGLMPRGCRSISRPCWCSSGGDNSLVSGSITAEFVASILGDVSTILEVKCPLFGVNCPECWTNSLESTSEGSESISAVVKSCGVISRGFISPVSISREVNSPGLTFVGSLSPGLT